MRETKLVLLCSAIGAILLWLALWYTIPFAHEEGHILICALEGHGYEAVLENFRPSVRCYEIEGYHFLYLAFGGIFAFLIALLPFVGWTIIKRSYYSLLLIASSVGTSIGQLTNAIIEAGFYDWYKFNLHTSGDIVTFVSGSTLFIMLLILLVRAWKRAN